MAAPVPVRSGLGRAGAVVAGGGLASTGFWSRRGSTGATYFDNRPGTTWSDSFGVRQVLSWLWRGELFDRDRWPVLTVLAAVGLVVLARRAVRRADEGARAVLVLTVVSLVLFFGATVVGPVVDRLPGREMLFLHRMVVGVHFGGVVLAGAGAPRRGLARAVSRGTAAACRRRARVPRPGAVRRPSPWASSGRWPSSPWPPRGPRSAATSASRTGGSPTSGAPRAPTDATSPRWSAWRPPGAVGSARAPGARRGDYLVGYVPAYIELLNLGADGVGFTGRVPRSPSRPRPATPDRPSDSPRRSTCAGTCGPRAAGPAGGRVVATRGRHVLWEVETTGPVTMVDTTAALRADRSDVALVSAPFLNSAMPLDGRFPVLALDGAAAAPPTLRPRAVPGRPGPVVGVVDDLGDSYAATTCSRDAALLVKTSYHPRWVAEVDGRPAPVVAVAPGSDGGRGPGRPPRVTVRFAGFPLGWRLALLAVGVAGLIAVGWWTGSPRAAFGRFAGGPGGRRRGRPAGRGAAPVAVGAG